MKVEFVLLWVVAPCSVMYSLRLQGWSWRQHDAPKRWHPATTLHGATTHKI